MGTQQREINIDMNPKTGVNKIIIDPIFNSMIELDQFRVMPNIRSKKKLTFFTRLNKILQKDIGCKFNPKGKVGDYSRWIEVEDVKVDLELCADEFKDHAIYQDWLKTGILKNDLSGTVIASILISLVMDAVPEDCKKLFWFGNKKSNDDFFNVMDGLWSVYLKELVDDDLSPYVNTNSGTALVAGEGEAILEKMYKAQSLTLKGLPVGEKRFYVTNSIWEQYWSDLKNIDNIAGRIQTENGQDVLRYRNILLVKDVTWDAHMTNELGKPDSHLCLLTTPKNLVMATNVLGDKNRLSFWFDRRDEQNLLKMKFKLGANLIHPAFLVIGY